jgi:protein SCO1/2
MRSYRSRASHRLGVVIAGAFACAMVISGSGCSRRAPTAAAVPRPPHYELTGEILSVDAAAKTARVRHDEIKGFMPAMTMDFPISAADASLVKAGDHVRGELVQVKPGEFQLQHLFLRDKVADDTVSAATRQLAEDTSNRGKNAYREVGETVPDFALYDQNGKVVQISRFRGKQVIVNFIYTRCPIATMCPAATMKMIQTQKLAREAGIPNLELISITLDPKNDTPGVLKEYARERAIDTSNFSFLTGPEKAIKDLLTQFGVIAEFEGDLIKHTLTTLLIDENGKIIHRADGSQWEPKDFVAKMKKAA